MAFRQVGSIGIRVRPDTSQFVEELHSKLDRSRAHVEVPVKADDRTLDASVRDTVHKKNASMRGAGSSERLRIPATVIPGAIWGPLRDIVRDANRQLKLKGNDVKIKVPVVLDKESLSRDIEDQLDRGLRNKNGRRFKVDIDLNVRTENAKRQIREFIRDVNNNSLDINPDLDHRGQLRAQLALLTRDRRVTVTPVINKRAYASVQSMLMALGGLNVIRDVFRDIKQTIKNMDRFAISIGKVGTALGLLFAGGFAGLASLSTIAAGIGQLGGAALVLPSILTAVVASGAVAVAAFKNFKTAIDGNLEALAKLPPNARKAALALQGTWREMQEPTQAAFWSRVGNGVQHAVDSVLPSLIKGMAGLGEELGSGFTSGLNGLSDAAGSGFMDQMFNNLKVGAKSASRSIGPLVRGFTQIGLTGTQYFPKIGVYLKDMADRFAVWANLATQNGSIDRWIRNAATSFGHLKDTVANLWGAFGAINDAAKAAGAGGLEMLAQKTEKLKKSLESIRSQTILIALFDGARRAMEELSLGWKGFSDGLLAWAPKFAKLMETIGTVGRGIMETLGGIVGSTVFQDGIQTLFTGFSKFFKMMADEGPRLGEIFGTIMDIAGSLIDSLSPVFGAGLELMAEGFKAIQKPMKDLSAAFSGALITGLRALSVLMPPLGMVLQVVADAAALVPAPILALGLALIMLNRATSGTIIRNMFNLGGAMRNLARSFTLGNALNTYNSATASGLARLQANMIIGLNDLAFKIRKGWANVRTALAQSSLVQGIGAIGSNIASGFTSMGTSIVGGIKSLGQKIQAGYNSAVTSVKSGASKLRLAVITGLAGLTMNPVGAANGMLAFSGKITGGIKTMTTAVASALSTAGAAIRSAGTRVTSALGTVGGGIASGISAIGKAAGGVGKVVGGIGKAVGGLMGGVVGGLGLTAALGAFSEMAAAAKQVQANTEAAARAARDLAKIKLKSPVTFETESIEKAGPVIDQMLDSFDRVVEIPSELKAALRNNRGGLLDLYLGNTSEAANRAKADLDATYAASKGVKNGLTDFVREVYTLTFANTDLHKISEGYIRDFQANADKMSAAMKDILKTDTGKIEANIGSLGAAVAKFGNVTPELVKSGAIAVHVFDGYWEKAGQFAILAAGTLGKGAEETKVVAAKLAAGMKDFGETPQGFVRAATAMQMPVADIEKMLTGLGYTAEESATLIAHQFGDVEDIFGTIVKVAGKTVPKMHDLSDGTREVAIALGDMTGIDPNILSDIFSMEGFKDPVGLANGLKEAGVGYDQIKQALNGLGVPAETAAKALERVAAVGDPGADWSVLQAEKFASALKQVSENAGSAAGQAEALSKAIDILNGNELSTAQMEADLWSSVTALGKLTTAPEVKLGENGEPVDPGPMVEFNRLQAEAKTLINESTGELNLQKAGAQDLFGALKDVAEKGLTSVHDSFNNARDSGKSYEEAMSLAKGKMEQVTESIKPMLAQLGLTPKQIDLVLQKMNLVPDRIDTDLLVTDSQANDALKEAMVKLNHYEDPRKVPLGALTDDVKTALTNAGIKLTEYEKGRYEANLGANTDEAKRSIDNAVNYLQSRNWHVNGSANINVGLIGYENAMKRVRGLTTAVADGGIFKNGHKMFADGGFNFVSKPTSAHIAMPGSYVTYAETETGGEAFIPLAPAKRDRSVEITARVADEFGYQLAKKASRFRSYRDGGWSGAALDGAAINGGSVSFNIVNHNPVQEKDSEAIARAVALGAQVGAI